MANKRNKSKAGSIRTRGKWGSDDEGVTFNTMCARLEGIAVERKHNLKPMKQRKAELLAKIQKRGPGGLGTHKSIAFYEPVLSKLVKDGDVVLKRIIHRRGYHGTNSTSMVATWFPEVVEERVAEPYAKKKAELEEAGMRVPGENQGKPRTETRVIKWNKKRDSHVLFDTLKGTADPDVMKEVNRTKTKFRKMRITKDEGNE